MKYGWFLPDYNGNQRAGFFVDDENRLLYWPQKEAPGYVINENIAAQIIATKTAHLFSIPLAAAIIFISLPLSFWITDLIYMQVTFLFSYATLGFAVWNVLLFLSFLIAWTFYKKNILSKRNELIADHLRGRPHIQSVRPPIQYLKYSEHPKTPYSKALSSALKEKPPKFVTTVIVLSIIAVVLLYNAISPDNRLGSGIVLWTYTVGFFCLVFYLVHMEVSGLRLEDIRFYKHHNSLYDDVKEGQEQEGIQPEKKGTKFIKAAGVALLILMLIPLAGYLDRKNLEPVTSDVLITHFENSVFRANGRSGAPLRLEKWNGILSIRSNGENNMLRNDIEERLNAYAPYTGLKIVSSQDPKNTDGVTITYLENYAPYGDEPPASFTYKGWQNQGQLRWVRYAINYDRLISENITGFKRRSQRVIDYTDNLAKNIALSVFGLYGNPVIKYSNNHYKDKSGKEIPFPEATIAMFYDPRIKPGMTRERLMPVVREIADEIENVESFEAWLKNRDAR